MREKELRFCEYYVESSNSTHAAIKAGYSKKSAKIQGWRLLKKDYIKAKISNMASSAECIKDITVNSVINEYIAIAFSDIGNVLDVDELGNVKVKSLNKVDTRVISELTMSKRDGVRVKMKSSENALRELYRILSSSEERKIDFKNSEEIINFISKLINTSGKMSESALKDKLNIIDKALRYHQINIDNAANENNAENIKAFLEATRPTKEEVEEMFKDMETPNGDIPK